MEGLIERMPLPRVLMAGREVVGPLARAGAFYAGCWPRWVATRGRPAEPPTPRPTISIVGHALVDEAVLAGFRLVRARSNAAERARYEDESRARGVPRVDQGLDQGVRDGPWRAAVPGCQPDAVVGAAPREPAIPLWPARSGQPCSAAGSPASPVGCNSRDCTGASVGRCHQRECHRHRAALRCGARTRGERHMAHKLGPFRLLLTAARPRRVEGRATPRAMAPRRAQAARRYSWIQAAETVDALDRSGGVARRFKGDRRVEADTPMRPGRVVVIHELAQHPLEMMSAEDEHPVEALPAGGPDKSLGVRVRPR